ncbi:MAG: Abi family protein [Lachnospiraceae bacterium]|nr:Abi family protein [Lachnospiraceae bacterium]
MSENVKPFKTIEEQIKILKTRGLIISDEDKASKLLSSLNYYRLSAYSLTLRKNDSFYDNVSFDDIIQIYNFDMELRAALMYLLESVEISMRTNIAYFFAEKYGPLGYYDSSNFDDTDRFNAFEDEYQKAIDEYGNTEAFVKHHKKTYNNQFPIWVLVELLTLGTLSRLFNNLKLIDRKNICKKKYSPINERYISNWLHCCTILRNICAHRARLYNRPLPISVLLGKRDKKIFKENNISINRASKQLFAYIIVIKKIIPDEAIWDTFAKKICELVSKYPFVRLEHYGFTQDWKEVLGIVE